VKGTLYRIDPSLYKIEKHKLSSECMPQLVDRYSYGELYRCRHSLGGGDHYGYFQRKEAKAEAQQLIRQEIVRLTQLLKDMGQDVD